MREAGRGSFKRTPSNLLTTNKSLCDEMSAVCEREEQVDFHEPEMSDRAEQPVYEEFDRVVIMLLFDQIVSEEQVKRAWPVWQRKRHLGDLLWRVLLQFPDIDRGLVYAEAARVYGYEEANVSRRSATPLLRDTKKRVGKEIWDQMVDLRVLPIAMINKPHTNRMQLVYAALDPAHPETQRLLHQLHPAGFELRFLPEHDLIELLVEVFPLRYKELKTSTLKELKNETAEQEVDVAPSETAELSLSEAEPETTSQDLSMSSLFEEVLEQAVRRGASQASVHLSTTHQSEVYFQVEGELMRCDLNHRMQANAYLSVSNFVHGRYQKTADMPLQNIKRWVFNQLIEFGVTLLPPDPIHDLGTILIRIVKKKT